MVAYIKSDLEFILRQIKIAEDHALYEQTGGAQGKPLFGANGSIPTYNLAWGLRTVDGTYNNPLYPERGAADNPFPEHLGTDYRDAEGTPLDMDGPGPQPAIPTAPNYDPSNNPGSIVVDGSVRTISNLIVDQTLGNPSAILTGLQIAGIVPPDQQLAVTQQISDAYQPLIPLFNAVNAAEREHAEASAAASASPGNQALQDAAAAALATLEAARAALDADDDALTALLDAAGIELSGANVVITNAAPDEGLSAPFNSWFTLFGQFFDHGLDLVAKGGSGTVFIPLQTDDPLYDQTSPTNFMVLTRASVSAGTDGIMNTADDVRPVNNTTSFVDQNQTYTSHPSHQVFLRQYILVDGRPVATGNLIEGSNGGMATWGDVKAQARDILGIDLTDYHVGNLPLLATDAYGNFIPDPVTGFPQVVMAGSPPTLASGTPAAPLSLVTISDDGPDQNTAPDVTHLAVRTGHAFLADIAHNAVPEGKIDDGDTEIGLANPGNGSTEYDNELLDAHFIAGDGRANENIGLTAVHHVFHAEHNRLVQHTKDVVFADAQAMLQDGASQAEAVAFLNEWLAVDVGAVPASAAGLSWDGERLFQAAKFGTEMQYQHLVFEEFARKVQPNINVFLVPDGYDVTLDPSIVAEFAHVVYRFGHSMLTESIDRFDPSFNEGHIGLIEGFLNPLQFANNGTNAEVEDGIAAGAIIRGMTRQVGNEIDEFVTSALRNNLLGLPLDLATINLARGRDTGVPSLNAARTQFYEATHHDALLKPYESWVDFAGHLKHEASIINFIAAYGTHALITGQTTIEGKRDAAMTLIFNQSFGGLDVQGDAADFLNATGAYAGGSLGGLNNVDLWIGGLAEAIMPFGGMLGSTFNFVFETQMENLQSGDRFYYLQRLDGLHLFGEMENNSFAAMIMRNTDATHLPSDVFSTPGLILEVDQTRQFNDLNGDGALESTDPVGSGILTNLVIRNDPSTPGADTHYLRYTGGDHVVLGGTDLADTLIAGIGDDTLYGDGGNDRLEGGFGNDIINAGAGDDIITDSGGDDNIKAGAGNDVVHAGPGLDLVMGNDGQDFIFLGTDMGSEVFAGTGNDFIYGNKNAERILGNEGNDWIETGTFDGAPGDNFDEIFAHDGIDGHDVFLGDGGFDEFIGEGGDDIMVGSPGRGKMAGMSGFDWATYKNNTSGVNADLSIPIIFDEAPTLPQNASLDEFESMEGLSGTRFNDVLAGTNDVAADRAPLNAGGTTGFLGSALDGEGITLVNGLQALLGAGVTSFTSGDILLGGDGSDLITGRMGDDIIDGDKWLDVQIGVFDPLDVNHTGTPIALHNSMTTLAASMFNGSINPGQLSIVRTIRDSDDQPDSDGIADVDVAIFGDIRANYTITGNDDGTISVAHVTVTDGLESDGVDRVSNIEILRFSDVDVSLTKPVVDLHAFDLGGTYSDTFSANAYNNSNGTTAWAATPWTETGDDNSATLAAGQIQVTGGNLRFDTGDGATITRTVPLAGAAGARLTYSVAETGLDGGGDNDNIQVQFSPNGAAPWTTVDTINSTTGTATRNIDLPGPFTATSAIRFVASALEAGDVVDITSVAIEFTGPAPAGDLNYVTSYTEGAAGVAITSRPNITDDGATLASAKIVLTNAQPGDDFDIVGGLPAGISATTDTSVDGVITLNLTGSASLAVYRTAIAQVTYDSSSENPSTVPRIIQVTVSDGLVESEPATTTINVTTVNDAPAGAADSVITNFGANVVFDIPKWALLANDTDAEGSPLSITGATITGGSLATLVNGTDVISISDNATANGTFNYVVSDGTLSDTTNIVTVTRDTTPANVQGNGDANIIIGDGTASTFEGLGGNDVIMAGGGTDTVLGGTGNDTIDGGDGLDTITGGTGDDVVDGGTGNDMIIWNANATGDTDGYDRVDGDFGTDTFDINTRATQAETFRVYTSAYWNNVLGIGGLQANTEIVITRTVGANTAVIAELDNIEEIRIGTQATDPVNGGAGAGDTVQIFGDFSTTSLALNTITIDGNVGDDTIDISSLNSAHRIVFRSNGGNDTIVGALRSQDVIELPDGATIDDYVQTVANGVTTLTNGTNSISYVATGDGPQFGNNDDDEDDCGDDDDPDTTGTPPAVAGQRTGTPQADVLTGSAGDDDMVAFAGDDVVTGNAGADAISAGEGADFVNGGDGRDVIFAGAGDDQVFGGGQADLIYGDAGADRIFGDGGDDFISAGAGDDTAFGGAGNDLFVAEVGDGNDVYFGDDSNGGAGVDTLDMSAATANVTVHLGSGDLFNGTASSSQTGNDTIWGIENVNTGSGNDTITASNAANVMNGGGGNDTYRFTSASAADGDTIAGFEAGDVVDLTAIDANLGAAGNQSFSLISGAFTAAGQLAVTFETRADGDFTVVQGNIDGNADADFTIEIAGHQNLTNSNVGL